NGLILAGRRDESRPGDGIRERASLAGLLAGTDPASPILLLEHEPAELTHLSDYGIDLAVSGHTHDGQIFPGNLVVRLFADQSYGLRKWNDTQVLVTSGVGFYGPPIRVGTISEIVVIDLR
ncbi:MAG: metallophosphoesterase, partial [Lachnospiraceae bacterium]|nr:metallophosphoesterase [Lachnospiraceae bacterium]